jgi:hypothetical protein
MAEIGRKIWPKQPNMDETSARLGDMKRTSDQKMPHIKVAQNSMIFTMSHTAHRNSDFCKCRIPLIYVPLVVNGKYLFFQFQVNRGTTRSKIVLFDWKLEYSTFMEKQYHNDKVFCQNRYSPEPHMPYRAQKVSIDHLSLGSVF